MPCNSERLGRVKVLVVDDHTLFAEGTVSLLSSEPHILAVGIAKNGAECLNIIGNNPLDVVLLDLNLPDTCGINLINKIRKVQPEVKIIILTGQDQRCYVTKSMNKGANGFLLKDCSVKEMTKAILGVYEGGVYFSESLGNLLLSKNIANNLTSFLNPKTPGKLLTAREKEIMILVSKGFRNKEIASMLGIKVRTVDFHVSNIIFNLGVSSRLEAVLAWVNHDYET